MRSLALLRHRCGGRLMRGQQPANAGNAGGGSADHGLSAWRKGRAGGRFSCLPSYRTSDMTVVDSQTVAYRYGGNQTYLVHLSGGCGDIAYGAALVTRTFGTDQMCAGDIARTLSGSSRMIGGSCSVQSIVPYSARRAADRLSARKARRAGRRRHPR